MARSIEQLIKEQLGDNAMRIAALIAEVEKLQEELKSKEVPPLKQVK